MPASPAFAARVYDLVARIPRGRVTTYGRIARAVGDPRGARMVGWALMAAVDDERDLPCHRVVNRVGLLSGGWHFGHPDVMRGLLLAEDVPFKDDHQVDLERCVWEPWGEDEDRPLPLDAHRAPAPAHDSTLSRPEGKRPSKR